MARQHRFRLLIRLMRHTGPLGLALLMLGAPLNAAEPAPTAAPAVTTGDSEDDDESGPPFGHFGPRGHGRGKRPPMPPPAEQPDLSKLSPGERRRFEENLKRWESLSPEQKEALRKRHEERRERMRRSIDRAIADSGLELTEEQRRDFARRFMKERRKIEHELRQEMNRKRKEAVDALVKQLAEEFRQTPDTPETE